MTTDELTRVFAALADPTRYDMVARLAEGDATVSQLAEPYRITLQAVYKHLRVLEEAGLVSRPPGPQPRPVRLEVHVFDLMAAWTERYRRRAEQRYRRLDAVLAAMDGAAMDGAGMDGAAMDGAAMDGAAMEGDEHDQHHGDSRRGRPEAADHPDDP